MNLELFHDLHPFVTWTVIVLVLGGVLLQTYALVTVAGRQRRHLSKKDGRLRIYLCSPFRGPDEDRNVDFAKKVARDLTMAGAVVFAPHLFFTLFLDDRVEAERDAGITNGQEIMKGFHEVWFVLPPWRDKMSFGMHADDAAALKACRKCIYAFDDAAYQSALTRLRRHLRPVRGAA